MKRFLALLAAVAMVLGAVLVRGLVDDGTAGDDDGDGAGGAGGAGSDGLELICGPSLLAACNSLAAGSEGIGVTQQAEADTAAAIAAGEVTLGPGTVWMAAGDWPAITAAGSPASSTGLDELAASEVLARSPAVIVARTDRTEAADAECGEVDWACVGTAADTSWTELGGPAQWGRVEVGLPSTTSGSGMVAVNQAVASQVRSSDFATNDLDDPLYAAWFDHLAEASAANTSSSAPLVEFIRRPGSLSVVGALEAEAIQQLTGVATADTLTVTAPAPVATADVRLWSGGDAELGTALDRLGGTEALVEALGGTGWRVRDSGGAWVAPGAASIGADMRSADTTLADSTGLPSPGTIFTVNERFAAAS